MLSRVLVTVLAALAVVDARQIRRSEVHAKRAESVKRFELQNKLPTLGSRAPEPKNITFTNPKASEFYVDGTTIPEASSWFPFVCGRS